MTLEFLKIKDTLNNSTGIIDFLTGGWVPDPVLMPSGRPNVVEGVGAIYHFVRGSEAEITEYVRKASPELAAKRAEAGEVVAAAGEFDGVALTYSLPHGQAPAAKEGHHHRVYKVYEKVVIWLEEKNKEVK